MSSSGFYEYKCTQVAFTPKQMCMHECVCVHMLSCRSEGKPLTCLSFNFLLKDLFSSILHVYLSACMSVYHMCAWCSGKSGDLEARKGFQIPWNWSYTQL